MIQITDPFQYTFCLRAIKDHWEPKLEWLTVVKKCPKFVLLPSREENFQCNPNLAIEKIIISIPVSENWEIQLIKPYWMYFIPKWVACSVRYYYTIKISISSIHYICMMWWRTADMSILELVSRHLRKTLEDTYTTHLRGDQWLNNNQSFLILIPTNLIWWLGRINRNNHDGTSQTLTDLQI